MRWNPQPTALQAASTLRDRHENKSVSGKKKKKGCLLGVRGGGQTRGEEGRVSHSGHASHFW